MAVATVTVVVPVSGDGPVASVASLVGSKTIVLSGSFEGSYTLLASQDGASFPPVATFDASGQEPVKQTLAAAYQSVRLRANANTAPSSVVTCEVSGVSVPGKNQFAVLATFPAGSGGISLVVDTHAVFPPTGLEAEVAFLCTGAFVGSLLVEGSQDGAGWNNVGIFQAGTSPRPLLGLPPLLEFAPLTTEDKIRYLRVTVLGQVTATTVVTVGGNTSFAMPSSTTLAEAYDNGSVPGDQTLSVTDAHGGGVVVDGSLVGFTGADALVVRSTVGTVAFPRVGGVVVDGNGIFNDDLAVRVATPTAYAHLGAGTAVAGTAPLKIDPGALLAVTESGAVESDGTHVYWTDAGGARWQLDGGGGGGVTLAQAYALGAAAADQTFGLMDAQGGGLVVNATNAGFTGLYALAVLNPLAGVLAFPAEGGLFVQSNVARASAAGATWDTTSFAPSSVTLVGGPATVTALAMVRVGQGTVDGPGNTVSDAYDLYVDAAPAGTAARTRSWSLGTAGPVQVSGGLVLGAGLAPPGESDLVVGAGGTVVSAANSGRLGYVAGTTQKFVVSMNGAAYVPLLTTVTLAQAYGYGTAAGDQTLVLKDAEGGGVVVNATDAGFTGTNALTVSSASGSVTFPRVGGLAVQSSLSKVAAAGTTWNEVNLAASTLALTGGPATVTAVSMVRVGQGTVNGAGNTVSDAYDLYVDAAPTGTATLTRPWSLGVAGTSQFTGNVGVNVTILPAARLEVVEGASVSTAGNATNPGTIKITNNAVNGPGADGGLEIQCETDYLGSGQGSGAKLYTNSSTRVAGLAVRRGSATWSSVLAVDLGTGNLNVGSGSVPGASTSLRVIGTKAVASAAGAVWDAFLVNNSTLTLSGASNVTALSFATIGTPTVSAASALTVDDFYALKIGVASFSGGGPASVSRNWSLGLDGGLKVGGGITVHVTDVNAAGPYTVLGSDYHLSVRYTATGAITINLPALTGGVQPTGRTVVVKDSGYNSATNNITVTVGNAADQIDGGAAGASYVMNTNGMSLTFVANTTTNNWELA